MSHSVKGAAIATGVSESRLRTWERRYGIPSPARSQSGRRQYDSRDLAIIRRMLALIQQGMPVSRAADAVRAEGTSLRVPDPAPDPEHPLVRELTDALLAYDEPSIARITEEAPQNGWSELLEQLLFPSLHRIGICWAEGKAPCSTEHFTTEVIRGLLSSAMARLPVASADAPRILLACPEAEYHDLGLLAMALLLRERGMRILYLGADVPTQDLMITIAKTRVESVCLSATTANGLVSLGRTARALVGKRAVRSLFVGGPALWLGDGDETALGTRLPRGLNAAADTIFKALGGS